MALFTKYQNKSMNAKPKQTTITNTTDLCNGVLICLRKNKFSIKCCCGWIFWLLEISSFIHVQTTLESVLTNHVNLIANHAQNILCGIRNCKSLFPKIYRQRPKCVKKCISLVLFLFVRHVHETFKFVKYWIPQNYCSVLALFRSLDSIHSQPPDILNDK